MSILKVVSFKWQPEQEELEDILRTHLEELGYKVKRMEVPKWHHISAELDEKPLQKAIEQ